MKKLLTGLLIVGMFLGLSACKQKPQEPTYDYNFMDFVNYDFVGPSEFADLKLSLKEFTSKDFSSDTEYIKVKKYMNELMPYVLASKTSEISNGDMITIGISEDFKGIDSELKFDLTPYQFEVSNLKEATYLDLAGDTVVDFYGVSGTDQVIASIVKDCKLPKEVQENLRYDITIDTNKVIPYVSIMDINISLDNTFLQNTKYSTMEDYFKSLGYIVESHSEQTLKLYVEDKDLLAAKKSDAMRQLLNEKLQEAGDIDNYEFVSVVNFQTTKTPYLYNFVAKYQSGEKIAYVLYESKMVYLLDDSVQFLTLSKQRTVDEKYVAEPLEGNKMVYTYNEDDFKIEEPEVAEKETVEETETVEESNEKEPN